MRILSINSTHSALKLLVCKLFLLFLPLHLGANDYLVLITGCGRSGTLYISNVLKQSGLDVGHEKFGKHGAVSWYMAVEGKKPPWGASCVGHTFQHIFHQMRHPLDVINSFYYNINPDGKRAWNWPYIYQHIPEIKPTDHPLAQVAKYWYYWNLVSEEKAEWSYRIEDIDLVLEEMGIRLGYALNNKVCERTRKDIHSWKRITSDQRLKWEDIEAVLSEEEYFNLRALATRYGYD